MALSKCIYAFPINTYKLHLPTYKVSDTTAGATTDWHLNISEKLFGKRILEPLNNWSFSYHQFERDVCMLDVTPAPIYTVEARVSLLLALAVHSAPVKPVRLTV